MKVLLTGATGFIGQRLALRLLRKGHDVVVLARHSEPASRALGLPCQIVAWDAAGGRQPALDAFTNVDAVISLAGAPVAEGRWTKIRKRMIFKSRVEGTRLLLDGFEAAVAQGRASPTVFISASAIGIYGDRGDEKLNESSAPGTGFLAEVCQAWEREALERPFSGALSGLRRVAVRIGVVLGREGGALSELLPIFRTGMGGPLGDGRQSMSWIHVDDLVSLFLAALENKFYSGAVNGTAPRPVSNREFATALGRAAGKPAVLPVPGVALRATLGERASIVLASQRVFPERALSAGFHFQFERIEDALADLGEGFPLGSADQQFTARQWVPHPVEKVFPFFSDTKNLEALTPPWLDFERVWMSTPQVTDGTLIDYRLKIHGVPVKWRSRIEDWKPGEKFVDRQLKGPYAAWLHTHGFESLCGGTLISDRVLFRLPAGLLGKAIAGRRISKEIASIFAYRRDRISERFS